MAQIPSLDDISLGVSTLSSPGIESVIATVSWSFAAEALADLWGFTRVRGADLEVDDATGLFTGRVSHRCEPEHQGDLRHRAMSATRDQPRSGRGHRGRTIGPAVVPFRRVQVAINASSEVQASASVTVDSQPLLDALTAVPGLLDPPTR